MQYIARQVPLQAEEIEILALKGQETSGFKANRLLEDTGDPGHAPMLEDPCLHILEGQETLGGLKANCISKKNHLVSKHLPEMGNIFLWQSVETKHYCELNSLIFIDFSKTAKPLYSLMKKLQLHFLWTRDIYTYSVTSTLDSGCSSQIDIELF